MDAHGWAQHALYSTCVFRGVALGGQRKPSSSMGPEGLEEELGSNLNRALVGATSFGDATKSLEDKRLLSVVHPRQGHSAMSKRLAHKGENHKVPQCCRDATTEPCD
jgi:hypothetical protein